MTQFSYCIFNMYIFMKIILEMAMEYILDGHKLDEYDEEELSRKVEEENNKYRELVKQKSALDKKAAQIRKENLFFEIKKKRKDMEEMQLDMEKTKHFITTTHKLLFLSLFIMSTFNNSN